MSSDLPLFIQAIYLEIDRISTVSLEECVSIIARFNSAGVEEIDYSRYKPWQIEDMKKSRRKTVTSLGVQFKTDLTQIKCSFYDLYATLFNQFEKHGTLPFPGALTEQPNYIIEVFNLFGALMSESQTKQQEQSNKKRK